MMFTVLLSFVAITSAVFLAGDKEHENTFAVPEPTGYEVGEDAAMTAEASSIAQNTPEPTKKPNKPSKKPEKKSSTPALDVAPIKNPSKHNTPKDSMIEALDPASTHRNSKPTISPTSSPPTKDESDIFDELESVEEQLQALNSQDDENVEREKDDLADLEEELIVVAIEQELEEGKLDYYSDVDAEVENLAEEIEEDVEGVCACM